MPASRARDRSRASVGPSPVEMARYHDIWVITRANNRPLIEAELARNPQTRPPLRLSGISHAGRAFGSAADVGSHLYYYLWQLRILGIARALHAEVRFDLVHHVTFVRYWAPSFLCFLGVPFVWGPVGGGESAPRSFWRGGGWRSVLYEASREIARWIGRAGAFRSGDGAPKRGCASHHRRDRGAAARARQQTGRDLFTDRVARR